jgi:hypothetical protein
MSEVLKRVYAPWFAKQLNNSWRPLKRISKNSKGIGFNGTALYWMVRYGRPHARAGGETAASPIANTSQNKQAYETPSLQFTTVEWSDLYIEKSKVSKAAFAREVQGEMEEHKDAMMASVARQMMGSGNGIVGTLRAASDGANPTLLLDEGQAKFFEVGNLVKVCNGTTLNTTRGSGSTALRVTEVDLENDQLGTTGDTIASSADGDAVIIYGSQASGTTYEMNGLQGICSDTTTLHGLDVSTYPWWKATVVKNGDAVTALDLSKLRKLLHHISIRGGKVSVIYCSYGVKRAFISLLQARQRYVDEITLDGGAKVEAFTGDYGPIPIIADRWAPAETMLALCEKDLLFSEIGGAAKWIDDPNTGNVVQKKSGYPIYEALMRWYPQIGARRRDVQGKLTNIEEES